MHAMFKWTGLVAAMFSCGLHAADVAWHDVIELASPDGDANVKSLALLPDGRMATTADTRGGMVAVMRFDAAGEETGRWLALPDYSPISFTYQPIVATSDGSVVALVAETSGWRVVTVGDDGALLGSFVLDAWATSYIRPVLGTDRFTLIVELPPPASPGRVEVRSYGLDGTLLAAYPVEAQAPDTGVPEVASLHGMPDGSIVLFDTRWTQDDTQRGTVRRLDADLDQLWRQDFAMISAPSLTWQSVREVAGGGLLVSGMHGSGASFGAQFALLDAQGELQWHAATPAVADAYAAVEAYAYPGGFAFAGIVSPPGDTCLLQGTIAADGSNLASTCTAFPRPAHARYLARHALPEGAQVATLSSDAGGTFVQRISKIGAQAATLQQLEFPPPYSDALKAVAMTQTDVAIVLTVPGVHPIYPPQRLLRWDASATLLADSATPAADAYHEVSDTLGEPDGASVFALEEFGFVHVVRSNAAGGIDWEQRVPGTGYTKQIERAPDGGYRIHTDGIPRVHALGDDGSFAWTHVLDGPVQSHSAMAVLDDGRTLLGYGEIGGGCRARRIGTNGALQADAALGQDGQAVDALSFGDTAVFLCHGSFQPQTLVRVDANLVATPITAPDCDGAPVQLAKLGGDAWVMASKVGSPPALALRFCRFEGDTLVQTATLSFPEATYLAWQPGDLHPDETRGRLHVGVVEYRDGQPMTGHVVYDAAANTAQRHMIRTGDALHSMSAPDSRGRIAWAFQNSDSAVIDIEFGFPSLGAKWRHRIPADLRAANARVVMAGDRLRVGIDEGSAWSQIVYRIGDTRRDVVFEHDFEGDE